MYSVASLLRTPLGPHYLSLIQKCPVLLYQLGHYKMSMYMYINALMPHYRAGYINPLLMYIYIFPYHTDCDIFIKNTDNVRDTINRTGKIT